jgi:hypothetical protein
VTRERLIESGVHVLKSLVLGSQAKR